MKHGKKVVSAVLLLSMLLSLILPLHVGAAQKGKIAEIQVDAFRDYLGDAAIRPEQTHPGDEIIIPLWPEGFRDENDQVIRWGTDNTGRELGPTVADLKHSGVEPVLQASSGYEYFRDIKLVTFKPTRRIPARAAVRIRFTEFMDSSKEFPYEYTVYLRLNKQITEARETFDGMIRNEILEAYNLDYVFIGDGQLVEGKTTSNNLEMDLGNGVSVFRALYPKERFYGRASIEGNEKQDAILEAYKDIKFVYDLTTIDVKWNGTPVKLTNEWKSNKEYYVYNTKGEYIGTSHEMLPYSSRYYLSTTEIDIDPKIAKKAEQNKDSEVIMSTALKQFVTGVKEEAGFVDHFE